MAGDWIKMRSNLDTHPKIVTIAFHLGTNELHVIGMLWKVWSWADQHSVNGNAVSVTSAFLDRLSGVTGFANALRNVGWLAGEDGAISLPRFEEHNGSTAKNRAESNARVAKYRENCKREVKHECNDDSVTKSATREEKRREEKRDSSKEESSAVISLPQGFDSEAVRSALADWQQHRQQLRKPLKPLTLSKLIEEWSELGAARFVAAVRHSIANGWQGLFERKDNEHGRGNHRAGVGPASRREESLERSLTACAEFASE